MIMRVFIRFFFRCVPFKLCQVNFHFSAALLCCKRIELTTKKKKYFLLRSHLSSTLKRESLLKCGYIFVWLSTSLCVFAFSVLSLVKMEGENRRVNLAILIFPQLFYMCNYIPPLIQNRALIKSGHNKELLFSCCVRFVCVTTTASCPWVFPLVLSSGLIPYGKVIRDWLQLCPFNKLWTSLRFYFLQQQD